MAVAGTINARLPETLKRHGSQVLAREGVSTTQAVRRLFEYLEREQVVPDWMLADGDVRERVQTRRERLRSLVGAAEVMSDADARDSYRRYLLEKHGSGVRE